MAKFEVGPGLEQYITKLQGLGAGIEGVIKFSCYRAAGMVIEAVKAATPERTGDLKDSMVLVPFRTVDGFTYTMMTIQGYDRNGVPNALKARAYESGTSTQPKRPFIRHAVNGVKAAAMQDIELQLNRKIDELMNK